MSDEREALARVIAETRYRWMRGQGDGRTGAETVADAVIAAGWRRSPQPASGGSGATGTPLYRCSGCGEMTDHIWCWSEKPAPSDAAQPADAAVIERAREIVAEWGASGDESRAEEEAYTMSRALLAEHARAEAAEREKTKVDKQFDKYRADAENDIAAAEAALAEARAKIKRLREALEAINARTYGSSYCMGSQIAEMSSAALEAGHGR